MIPHLANKIKRLPPAVAERIAAGEVIERPASVVKELVENSLDAKASHIFISLDDGGKSVIEVIDNGCGISKTDLPLAIERHATSKITSLDELSKIQSLGFRGEALPSIAAAGQLTIISRVTDSNQAFELVADPHFEKPSITPITFGHFMGSKHGTCIRVESLFSLIPARLKFLRSSGAEVSAVREWIEKLAAAYPHVEFDLVSRDQTLLHLKATTPEARTQALLSDDAEIPIISREVEIAPPTVNYPMRIQLSWAQGLSLKHSRKLIQIINGRPVRDRLLQQALLKPFRQALLPGRYPALVLKIETDPESIDVNVHPTKMEVRFFEPQQVFHQVEKLAQSLIEEEGSIQHVSYARNTSTSHQTHLFHSPLETQSLNSLSLNTLKELSPFHQPTAESTTPSFASLLLSPALSSPSKTPGPSLGKKLTAQDLGRYVGILFATYLVFEREHELFFIDQHAAHERIRFEKLKSDFEKDKPKPQKLLFPEAIRFPIEDRKRIESRIHWLEEMGFEVEVFSEQSLIFRATPTAWGSENLHARLKNLVDDLIHLHSDVSEKPIDESIFERLAMQACRSSVKAGDHLEREEVQSLVSSLFKCEHPWNCPHGRPTITRIAEAKIEEWFQRRLSF